MRKKTFEIVKEITIEGRSYKNYDKEIFQNNLSDKDWTEFFRTDDAHKAWDIMQIHILSELDVMCPLKSFRIRMSKDPCLTNELVERIIDKDRLLSKAK